MLPIQTEAVIYAKDYLRIAEFYVNVANLEVHHKDNTYMKLESGVFQLVVLQIPKRIADIVDISVPPVRREDIAIKLVFFVNNIDIAREAASNYGGELNNSEKE